MASSLAFSASGFASGRCQLPSKSLRPRSTATVSGRRPVRTLALFGGNKEGGGGMGNLLDSIKKAQQFVQVEAGKVQEELAATEFEGYSEDETVRAVMTGNQVPLKVEITAEAHAQGAEKTAALVLEAFQDAHKNSVEGMKTKMAELAGRMGLPAPPQM